MSRTDRHRPYWVQVADYWEKNKSFNHWSGSHEATLLHKTCGCYMCGYDAFQVPLRRVQRYQARRQLRAYLRGADSWD